MHRIAVLLCCFLLSLSAFAGEIRIFSENNKKGIKDENGKVLIPALYDELGWSQARSELFVNKVTGYKLSGKWGLVTSKNKMICESRYLDLYPASERSFLASRPHRWKKIKTWGLISSKGKILHDFEWVDVKKIGPDRLIAKVMRGNVAFYGLVSAKGKVLIPFVQEKIMDLGSGYLSVTGQQAKTAVYSWTGERLSENFADSITACKDAKFVYFSQGRAGISDASGQVLQKPVFRSVNLEKGEGVLYPSWKLVTPGKETKQTLHYEELQVLDDYRLVGRVQGGAQLLSACGEKVTDEFYDSLGSFQYGLSLAKKGESYGLVDSTGQWVLRPHFKQIERMGEYALVNEQYGRMSYAEVFDVLNRRIVSDKFQEICPLNGRYFAVRRGEHWGVARSTGNLLIECRYDSVLAEERGLFKVIYWGKKGYINTKDEWALRPQQGEIQVNQAGNFLVSNQWGHTILSQEGEKLYYSPDSLVLHPLGFLYSGKKQKTGILDRNGRPRIEASYDRVYVVQLDSLFGLKKGSRVEMIDKNFQYRITTRHQMDSIVPSRSAWLPVCKDGRYGYIDTDGLLRLANRYQQAGEYSEKRAPVKLQGKWGYVNELERLVVQPWYDEVSPFHGGTAIVARNGHRGMIDLQGRILVDVDFEKVVKTKEGGGICMSQGLYGYYNAHGMPVIARRYESIEEIGDFLLVKRGGRFGVIDKRGVNIVPVLYDRIVFDARNKHFLCKQSAAARSLELH
ncbi:MAG: WG repeat-containing protein [Cytophagales bacterium]|nr:WG repeat-containing protein [Cytophagales bacterium]